MLIICATEFDFPGEELRAPRDECDPPFRALQAAAHANVFSLPSEAEDAWQHVLVSTGLYTDVPCHHTGRDQSFVLLYSILSIRII